MNVDASCICLPFLVLENGRTKKVLEQRKYLGSEKLSCNVCLYKLYVLWNIVDTHFKLFSKIKSSTKLDRNMNIQVDRVTSKYILENIQDKVDNL